MQSLSDLLTIVIPVKNEEKNLPACLENIADFKHVLLVDSQSTDGTLELFRQFAAICPETRQVLSFVWNGGFPKKRNWALRTFSFQTPWVMFLDADERMTPAWKEAMTAFLNAPASDACDVIKCFYDNWFMGRLLRHGDCMQKSAVMRVGAAEYEFIDEKGWSSLDMEIHEQLQPKRPSAIYEISARLEHHDMRSLESYNRKHEEYANWEANRYRRLLSTPGAFDRLTARQKFKYGHLTSWWMAPFYFLVCYFLKRGFLDGVPGFRFAWGKMNYFASIRRKVLSV